MTITSSGPLTLIVAWRQGTTTHGRVVKVGGDVAHTLRTFAAQCAETLAPDAAEYDPDSPSEDGTQRVAPREEAFDTVLLDTLAAGGSHDTARDEDLNRPLACWAVVLGEEDDQTIYVHRHSPITLAKKPLLAGLIDNSLTAITDRVFGFDAHFDLVITSDKLFILDQNDFEALFKESPAVLARAGEWATSITSQLPVTEGSTEVLEDLLRRNSVVRRKVTSILRRPYFASLDTEVVRTKLEEHGLNPAVFMPNDELNFTRETALALVRFLNEDLFQGDFSNEPFAASGKQRL